MNRMDHWNFAACEGASGGGGNSTWRERAGGRVGVLQRIFNAIVQGRQRQADREIARHLCQLGGRLNDDTERRMMDWVIRRRMY